MTNNDFLRSFRYALELDPSSLLQLFASGGADISLHGVAAMLKDDGEPGFERLSDEAMTHFLDGVIAAYRGQRESSATVARAPEAALQPTRPEAPATLTNNRILRALRIAFELRDTDIQALMQAAGREVSKSELGALFRREDHRNYQACGDQFMRAFLRGLGLKHRQRPAS